MGTGPFALASLEALWGKEEWDVAAVYTKAAKPAGRGMKLKEGPVAEFALEKGIPLYRPKTLRTEEAKAEFLAIPADLAVVASYGLILPKYVLDAPAFGCVNVHGSLLPAYRGAAPIQRAVMDGQAESGVTLMQMDEGLDTGDMLATAITPIGAEETAGDLFDRLAVLGASLLAENLPRLFRGELTPIPQPAEGASYAHKISPEDQVLDFARSATELERQIRGLSPVPGALCHWAKDGKLLKVLEARAVREDRAGEAGEIIAVRPRVLVKTGEGLLELIRVQPEGKGKMQAQDAVNGRRLNLGDLLCP